MKTFIKMVLAVVVGLILTSVLSMLLLTCSFAVIGAAAGGSSEVKATQKGDVLFLKMNGEVTEQAPAMPFNFSILGGMDKNSAPTLTEVLNAIAVAEKDENIVGIYLNTDGMASTPAALEAIHDRLAAFKANSGKWIISYNDSYSAGQYYVASVADSLYVNTIGGLTWDGMTSLLPYPKGLLDKLGIEMQVFRCGQYKSAVEMYMIDHISEANYEQTSVYLRSIWDKMVDGIVAVRPQVSADSLNALADLGVSYFMPEEIAATGMVDGMVYKRDVEKVILGLTGNDKLQGLTAKQLAANYATTFPTKDLKPVAVLSADGEIAAEAHGTDGNIYYEDLIAQIREVEEDEEVTAVVLRVNSPGGSAYASEQIWKALEDLKAAGKHLVISMGGYAASGGYYISAPGEYIVAQANTLTGSIGVFGTIPNLSGLVTGKLGVNFEEVKTHKNGQLNTMRKATPYESEMIQKGVNGTYDLFTSRVAAGRCISQDSVKVIGGGRVWTGSDALKIGLVDEIGNLDAAVAKAAELAGYEAGTYFADFRVKEEDTMAQLMALFGEEPEDLSLRIATSFGKANSADVEALKFIKKLQRQDRIQAREFIEVRL